MRRAIAILGLGWMGILLLATGCSKGTGAQPKHLHSAGLYEAAGELERAEEEYLAALRADPNNAEILTHLALFYHNHARFDLAAPLLQRIRELRPNNLEVRLKLAAMKVAARRMDEAREDLLFVLEQTPGKDEAVLLLSETVQRTNEEAIVRQALETNRVRAGDRSALHLALASLQMKGGDGPGAEAELQKALNLDPRSSAVQMALANLAWLRGDHTNAEAHFQQARALLAPGSPQLLRLVDYKMNRGAAAEARILLEEITTHSPGLLSAWQQTADLAFQEQRYPDCERAVTRLLALCPTDCQGLLLREQLRMKDGEVDGPFQQITRLSAIYPRAASVQYVLGELYLLKRDATNALSSLARALVLDPSHKGAALRFAEIKLRQGQPGPAVEALRFLISRHPGLVQAHLLLADAYRLQGSLEEALALYQRIGKAIPSDPRSFHMTGVTLRLLGRTNEARQAFEQVLALAPASTMTLQQMVELECEANHPDEALQRLQTALAKNPKSTAHWVLLAETHYRLKHVAETETALQKALALDPNSTAAHLLLINLLVKKKDHAGAMASAQAVLTKDPDNPKALLQKAWLLKELKEEKADLGSRDTYERLVQVSPRFVPGLLGLVSLYVDRFNDLDRALDLAQRARELAPRDLQTAYFLGAVLFERKDYAAAVGLLQECTAGPLLQQDALFRLGLAQYMMGEEPAARATLQQALRTALSPAQQNEARICLDFLNLNGAQASPDSIVALERRLSSVPGDCVALRRLEAAYEHTGQASRLLAFYEQASQARPKDAIPAVQLARYYTEKAPDPVKALTNARRAEGLALGNPRVLFELARIAAQNRDDSWAFNLIRESARQQPLNLEVWYEYAQGACRMGLLDESEGALGRVLEANTPFPRLAEAQRFQEMLALARDPTRAAEKAARVAAVLKGEPDHLPALLAWGLIQEHTRQKTGAIQTYEMILAPTNHPWFMPATRQLAGLFAERGLQETRALEMAQKAHAADLQDWTTTKTLAKLLYRHGDVAWAARLFEESGHWTGDDPEARFYLSQARRRAKLSQGTKGRYPADVATAKALSQRAFDEENFTWAADLLEDWRPTVPNDAEFWLHLGLAEARLGQFAQARESLARGLSLDPNHPLAASAKRALSEPK